MRRRRETLFVVLALASAAGGCRLSGGATPSFAPARSEAGGDPFRSDSASRTTADPKRDAARADADAATSSKTANKDASLRESDNPFRARRDRSPDVDVSPARTAGDDGFADRTGIGHGRAEAPKDSATDPPGEWDDETRALVAAELRATPADERAELERDLNGLNAAFARKIVTMRRLLRQMEGDRGDGPLGANGGGEILRTQWTQERGPARLADSLATDAESAAPLGSPRAAATTRPRASRDIGRATPWDDSRKPANSESSLPWFGRGTDGGPSPPVGTSLTPTAPPMNTGHGSPPSMSDATLAPPPWPHLGERSQRTAGSAGAWTLGASATPALRNEQALMQAAFDQAALQQTPGTMGSSAAMSGSPGLVRLAATTAAAELQRPPAASNSAPGGAALLGQVQPAGAGIPVSPMAAPNDSLLRHSPELQQLLALAEADAHSIRLTSAATEAERQAWLEKQVHLRMLYLVAGQQERALQAIPGIDAADQEFWQQTFWAVSNYFDAQHMPERSDRAAQTVAQLRTAIARLQETARLELRNVSFCQKISSYGSYEKFARDEFSRGQPVLIYAEVTNFKSVPAAEGQHLTRLRSSVAIYNPAGGLIERIAFPETEDLCRNPRRDYFHSYQFNIPNADKLPLGPHVLKLTVEDLLSQKVAEYSVNFMVK